MRRAFICAGVAAGALALFTSMSYVGSRKETAVQDFKIKLSDLAFCQKGFEIASSFPSYVGSQSADPLARAKLTQQADRLQVQSELILNLIEGEIKEEAASLGIDGFEFEELVSQTQQKAELEAVMVAGQVEEPEEFLNRLNEVCSPYLRK